MAFPDSSSVLDKFRSARKSPFASDFRSQGNRASLGPENSHNFAASVKVLERS